MIGSIKGELIAFEGSKALIETSGGIGYLVYVMPTFISDQIVPRNVFLFIYTQVREDAIVLYGFDTIIQKNAFLLFLGVSGVGPKTAHNIISCIDLPNLSVAVEQQDLSFFKKIPGLGKKTAEKVLLELTQKYNKGFSFENVLTQRSESKNDIVFQALESLGFQEDEIQKTLKNIDTTLSVEERIKNAIKLLTYNK